jgi:nicotinamidase/pyrazinamidase
MKVLIVVDMQNDFINGSLGTREAEAIVGNVEKKIREWDGLVIATQDTHSKNYLDTQEGRNLPVEHCIEGSDGWQIHPVIKAALTEKKAQSVCKPTFGSVALAMMLVQCGVSEIHLVGLCTDICVVSNALLLKANMPEVPIYVDSSCCAGVTPAKHEAALETMKSCQINVL